MEGGVLELVFSHCHPGFLAVHKPGFHPLKRFVSLAEQPLPQVLDLRRFPCFGPNQDKAHCVCVHELGHSMIVEKGNVAIFARCALHPRIMAIIRRLVYPSVPLVKGFERLWSKYGSAKIQLLGGWRVPPFMLSNVNVADVDT